MHERAHRCWSAFEEDQNLGHLLSENFLKMSEQSCHSGWLLWIALSTFRGLQKAKKLHKFGRLRRGTTCGAFLEMPAPCCFERLCGPWPSYEAIVPTTARLFLPMFDLTKNGTTNMQMPCGGGRTGGVQLSCYIVWYESMGESTNFWSSLMGAVKNTFCLWLWWSVWWRFFFVVRERYKQTMNALM